MLKKIFKFLLILIVLSALVRYKMDFPTSFVINVILYLYCFFVFYFLFIFKKYRFFDLLIRWITFFSFVLALFTLSIILKDIDNNSELTSKNDYVIVLGAGLSGKSPKTVLRYRLDRALEYYRKNKDTIFIVSGGQGKNEVISESEAMKSYLVRVGIPKDRIIEENKSKTTLENLKFSKELVPPNKTVGVISNDFHLYRVKFLAIDIKFPLDAIYAKTPKRNMLSYYTREIMAIISYRVRDMFDFN